MNLRGVVYDVGTLFSGLGWTINSRPRLDPGLVRRELEIIRDDLHCNAVRVSGGDISRTVWVGREALRLGLGLWLSPVIVDRDQSDTLKFLVRAGEAAERLRKATGEEVVLSVGSEATLMVRGIVPGRTIPKRLANLMADPRNPEHSRRLERHLARVRAAVGGVFHGALTYAALPFEQVDWSQFDVIGVDHYRDARIKDRYLDLLRPHLGRPQPVVITEFGMRTYAGAETSGALGLGIVDQGSLFLHQLPLLGRWIRPHLTVGPHRRDEAMQAREVGETLVVLEMAGVEGAFVCEFVSAGAPYSEDPRYDLDMSALSLVRTLPRGHGQAYPDMPWEPKQAFYTVASFFATHPGRAEWTRPGR